MNRKSNSKSFVILILITIVEKALSFVYQAVMAAYMGANAITDAFFSAAELFTLIDATLINALVIAVLNVYSNEVVKKDLEAGLNTLSNALSIMIPCSLGLCSLTFVLARPISFLIAPGFSSSGRELLINNIQIMSAVPVILTFTMIHQVILRQRQQFVLVGLKSLFISISGICSVVAYVLLDNKIPQILCIGYVFAIFIYAIISFIDARRYGRIKVVFPSWGPTERMIMKMVAPLIISNGITRLSLMIDRIMASFLGEGSVTCLTYSHTLANFVIALFITNLCIILISDFTNLFADNKINVINDKVQNAIGNMLIILLPITILSIVYSTEIVSIVFERGSFGSREVDTVSGLLVFYAIGFIPTMMQNVYLQVYYAVGNTKKAMYNSLIAIGSNITISVLLTLLIGINGIAIGTTCSVIISSLIYNRMVRKHIDGFRNKINKRSILNLSVASVVLTCISLVFKRWCQGNELVVFLIASVLSCTVYCVILLVFKDETAKNLVGIIKRRLFDKKTDLRN